MRAIGIPVVQNAGTRGIDNSGSHAIAKPLDPYGRFLKLADVMQSIGVSQAMVYKLMHDEKRPFPRPIKVGRASLWVERDVVAWKAQIISEVRRIEGN